MRLRIIISVLLAALSIQGRALDVTCTAGGLHKAVTDTGITTLRVSGEMDARDFHFIAQSLQSLVSIDLTQVSIVQCHITNQHYLETEFAADELPTGAFSSMALTSVKLPAGLKRIGRAALADCASLTSIELPAALVDIGNYAFASCTALTAMTLPANVETVGLGAFMRCTALTSFTVEPSSHLTRLGDQALMDCPALTHVELGPSITSIGKNAFTGTGLQQLDLSGSTHLKEIDDWALTMTPVTTVNLPSSLNRLGTGALLYASRLDHFALPSHLTVINDYTLAGTALQGTLRLGEITTLGDYALYNNHQLAAVELPASTRRLGTRSMAGLTGLTALTCRAATPPELGKDVWLGVNQAEVPLSVPSSSIDQYKAASQWMQFLYPEQWLKGDVNNDGSVNISDINVVIGIILGTTVDDGTMQRADVNEDGSVNISDVNLLLNIIMNPSSMVILDVDTQDQLSLPDVTVTTGQQVTVPVSLDNASSYSALQCDITLPQGLRLVSATCPDGHVMHCSPLDGTTSRIAVYSLQASHFAGEEPVFTMTLTADKPLPQDGLLTLGSAVIASAMQGWHPADCTARVSTTTHVDDLTTAACRVWTQGRSLCIEVDEGTTAILSTISGMVRHLNLEPGVNRYELEPGFYVVVIGNKSHKIAIQ